MRFVGLKNCDTCKKALKALQAAGIEPEVIDVRADGVSADDLTHFFAALGDDLINRRSTTWRGLSEADRGGDPLPLLVANPTLMKRPVIEADDGKLTLGWTKDVQAKFLG